MPDNEDDGIAFLKSLANSLDDLSKQKYYSYDKTW